MAKVAKPSVDAAVVFSYAEAFSEATGLLDPQFKNVPPHTVTSFARAAHFAPKVTLDAFATELYLKCLRRIDLGEPGWGHDCKRLFGQLKAGTQKAVRLHYANLLSTHPAVDLLNKNSPGVQPTLEFVLDKSSDIFKTVRYLYEHEGENVELFYWPLVRMAVRETILTINPAWRR